MPNKTSNPLFGLMMAASTALCWGGLAILLKIALPYASSGTIVWFRMIGAFTVLAAYMLLKRPKEIKPLLRPPPLAILAGLCLAFNYFGFMKGVELNGATSVQIMIQIGPVILAGIGIFYFKETPTLIHWLGMIVALFGFVLFYKAQGQVTSQSHASYLSGHTWVISSAIAWALFASIQKQLVRKLSTEQINFILFAVSSIALFPMAKVGEITTLSFWPALLFILLALNSVFAYTTLGLALKHAPASLVSLVITTNPLLTLAIVSWLNQLSFAWFQPEPISLFGYTGAILVIIGVSLSAIGSRRARLRSRS